MKHTFKIILAGFALALFTSGSISYADDAAAKAEEHKQHHPEGTEKPKEATKAGGGMMGSMHMGDMSEMMHKCMDMHKDGKMCDHQTMEKCQENMSKGDCQKMMKQAKKEEKTKKK